MQIQQSFSSYFKSTGAGGSAKRHSARLTRLLSVALTLVFIAACATSPTGRRQLVLLDDPEINQMGAEAFEEMKKQIPIDRGAGVNGYVNCIVNALLAVTDDTTGVSQWEVVVFRENSANAFALPGGKIGVHTGILPVARTPGQLAAVLGHEIAHVIARHGNERVSQSQASNTVLGAVGAVVENEAVLGAIGAGAQFGVMLPFGRAHETEADVIGQELMAKAGFDPSESVKLWENMAELSGDQPPEIMSTHPAHDTRISDLREGLTKNLPLYQLAQNEGRRPNCRL
ncbi:MAG: M48 family metallopeptidase [bacterium]|nr:M48 family metallopeptidase [bacterium]